MVDKIEGATIIIGGDPRPAEAAIEKVAKALEKMGTVAEAALAGLGIGLGVNELLNMASASAKLATEFSKLSDETGASVTGIQAVRHAAEQGGVSVTDLAAQITALSAALATVEKGGGEDISKAFERLGISATELQGLDIDEQFTLISDAVSKSSLSAKDLNEALKTLGITNAELIGMMRDGGDAFEKAREEIQKMGLALSDVDAAAIRNASEEWDRFKAAAAESLIAVGNIIAKDFAPFVSDLLKRLQDVANVDFIANALGASLYASIGVVAALSDAVVKLQRNLNAIPESMSKMLGGAGAGKQDMEDVLPSVQIKEWLRNVQEASTKAAEATVESARIRREAEAGTTDIVATEEDKQLAIRQAAAQQHLDHLLKVLLTAEDFENASYQRRMEQLIAFNDQGLLTQQQYDALVERNNQVHLDKINEAQSKSFVDSQRLYVGYAGQIGSLLTSITSAIGAEGKKQFAISKAIALASAIVKGYESIVSAYAAGSRIGGPPVGAAFAAIAAASTAAQIAALRNTNENSSGGGGSGSTGGGESAAVQPTQTLTVQGIDPTSLMTGEVVKNLAGQLLQYQADGGKVILQ